MTVAKLEGWGDYLVTYKWQCARCAGRVTFQPREEPYRATALTCPWCGYVATAEAKEFERTEY